MPTVPTSRANKRRSFLPIDVSPIPIPAASQFVPGITATNSAEDVEELTVPAATSPVQSSPVQPSPLQVDTYEEIQRREQERAREARIRALRSVMSYLRDMHDLTRGQTQTMSMYGIASPDSQSSGTRSRRPTMVDNGRLPSENSVASIGSGGSSSSRPESVNLRSTEGRIGMRGGSTTQTNSVATTDSTGSKDGEERKYKDDKAKRARVIREIVEYVLLYVFSSRMILSELPQDGAHVRQGPPRARRHLHQARLRPRQRNWPEQGYCRTGTRAEDRLQRPRSSVLFPQRELLACA